MSQPADWDPPVLEVVLEPCAPVVGPSVSGPPELLDVTPPPLPLVLAPGSPLVSGCVVPAVDGVEVVDTVEVDPELASKLVASLPSPPHAETSKKSHRP
jgi:hypothetical protein